MTLRLFNTLEREKEEFEPIEEGKVRLYSCGQTIYDDLHVGNARAYVAWDTLRRYMEWKGYTVRHVQNITDVGHLTDDADQGEDKVLKRAEELGLEPMELVEEQIERYFEDTAALNVERQDIVPRATGHIHEMIEYVKQIVENGYAYEVDGNVYMDVEKAAEKFEYGEMAKKDLQDLKEEAESRVEPDENKKNQFDFALWLEADEGHLMKWESPWSVGYPGWHIECTVMSEEYLGDLFDIHTGGKDHIFPHHPNERAQSFAGCGTGQANYWLHNEFVTVEGEKMSKSEGNFYTVRELLEKHDGDAIRLYLISSHYRSEMDFSLEGLEQAEKELKKVRKTVQRMEKVEGGEETDIDVEGLEERFEEYMDDDLNTAKAKQVLVDFVGEVNSVLEKGGSVREEVRSRLIDLFKVLGVDVDPEISEEDRLFADLLVTLRERYREEERYGKADEIRQTLEDAGFIVEDTGEGAIWLKE
ncbi:MAG: cysteine--tRNA ligase [Candidatus Nanohaloarchaeota archaeon QJJ-7]|nr:cysteine--tRNA ligase [Candidatus Nanohaloarchaeota archaeon QJJ-7]